MAKWSVNRKAVDGSDLLAFGAMFAAAALRRLHVRGKAHA